MSQIYEVNLPLPPLGYSPNRRGTWGKWAGERAAYRRDCRELLNKAFGRPCTWIRNYRFYAPITVHVDFYMGKSVLASAGVPDGLVRPRDCDNAIGCIKGVLDSMRDACLVNDDSAKFVSIGTVNLFRTQAEHGGRCGLVLRIECAEEGERE